MKIAPVADVKARLSSYLEQVENGPVIITKNGRPVAALAAGCRFTDCAHAGEPGCAVAEAVDAGTIDADRVEHYRRLGREAAFEERKRDKAVAANAKKRWKQSAQALKTLYRVRGRGE